MLAYLNELCLALLERDSARIQRLLQHPSARQLPRAIREEVIAIAAHPDSGRAPIRTLQFYHQTEQLLTPESEPVTHSPQLELHLAPSYAIPPYDLSVARAMRIPAAAAEETRDVA